MNSPFVIRQLGLQAYQSTWEAMQTFTATRQDDTPDEIWLLEHPPIFTQGQAGRAEHLLNPGNIPVVQTDRGGQVTYHGPGQLIAYLMLDLRRTNLTIRDFVCKIETALIAALAEKQIIAVARRDAPGVYVNGAKIASLGLRVKRGCTYHGLALNVDMDLAPFGRINPCGMSDLAMTQVCDFAKGSTVAEMAELWLAAFYQVMVSCHPERSLSSRT